MRNCTSTYLDILILRNYDICGSTEFCHLKHCFLVFKLCLGVLVLDFVNENNTSRKPVIGEWSAAWCNVTVAAVHVVVSC